MKTVILKIIPVMLFLLCLFFVGCVSAETEFSSYVSDFRADEDGWYGQGNAEVSRTKSKTLIVTGRKDILDSPCKSFNLTKGVEYFFSVEVRQDAKEGAYISLSRFFTENGELSFRVIGEAFVPKGEWYQMSGRFTVDSNDPTVLGIRTSSSPTIDYEIRSFELRRLRYKDYYEDNTSVYIENLPYRQHSIGVIRPADFLNLDQNTKSGIFQCSHFTTRSFIGFIREEGKVNCFADIITPEAGIYNSFWDDDRLSRDESRIIVLPRMEVPDELIGTWEYNNNGMIYQCTFHDDNTVTCLKYLDKNTFGGKQNLFTHEFGYNDGFIDLGGEDFFWGLLSFEKGKLEIAGGDIYQRKKHRVLKKVKKERLFKTITLNEQSQFFEDKGAVLLSDLGYRSQNEYRALCIDMIFEPSAPTDPRLIIHNSNPDAVEVLGYDYNHIYLHGKNEGITEIQVEAADGSGVISNSVKVKVLKGERSVPEQLLGKAWKFVFDNNHSYPNEDYIVFGENGICARYSVRISSEGGMQCSFSNYRYLNGMIQLEDEHFQNLCMMEEDGQICLRSKGNYVDGSVLSIFSGGDNRFSGAFYATELLTGVQECGPNHIAYRFDQNGIPWDEKNYHTEDPAFWIPVENYWVEKIER